MRRLSYCFALLLIASAFAAAQDSTAKVAAEIERLQKFAAAQNADAAYWKDLKTGFDRFLLLADVALKRGDTYFAVEELGKANEYIVAYQATQQSPEILKQGLEGFESVWKKSHVELTSLDTQAKQRQWTGVPVAMRALAESGEGQAPTLLEASRAYASVTEPSAGYFYLGQARANEQFGGFIHSLSWKTTGKPFPLRSILAEILKLQEKENALFVPPRSIEKHPQFIRLNSTIKTAGELDAARLYAGALYQYLSAMQQFALLTDLSVDDALKARLPQQIEERRKELKQLGRDDSIAEMYLQRAEILIASKNGTEPTADEWKNAAAVVAAVIPAYKEVLNAPASQPTQNKNAVTLTLVRWPYT